MPARPIWRGHLRLALVSSEAGLLRAADLIGQLADPLYPRKLDALFHEFAEIGVNEKLRLYQSGRRGRAIPPFLLD